MCTNALQRDTVLVTDVVGRIERALADNLKIEGDGLHDQIRALAARGTDKRVIEKLHYLRMERNQVIHHPRRELANRGQFEAFSREALPHIEAAKSETDLLQALINSRIQDLYDKLSGESSLDERLEQQRKQLMDRLSNKLRLDN